MSNEMVFDRLPYFRGNFKAVIIALLAITLLTIGIISIGIGAVNMSVGQVIAILAKQIHITLPWSFESQQESVLLTIRLPRILLGILIGSGIAIAGTAMQGLFRNPLADPSLIGVSSGAAVATAILIVITTKTTAGFASILGLFALPLAAFIGGLLATFTIYRLANVAGHTAMATMLLAGIAINALAGAVIGLLTFIATDVQLRTLTFWSLGSLGGTTWSSVTAAAPFILAAIILLPRLARALNTFLLGEAEAGHLGINVERVKQSIVILCALAVGASVAVSGIIGFVGLIVPHLLRLIIGPDHRYLLPGSALLGAVLLLGADLIARTLVAPAELPIGIVTSIVGVPFFLWLLRRDIGRING